jgi:hypothetical protein
MTAIAPCETILTIYMKSCNLNNCVTLVQATIVKAILKLFRLVYTHEIHIYHFTLESWDNVQRPHPLLRH